MTKAVNNREQLERAINQKRDPRTDRFTRAPHGVVVRRASAASAVVMDIVRDVPPSFERIAPNLNRVGGLAFPSAEPKATARGGLSTKAAERALRVRERHNKKVCMKTRYLVCASSSAGTAEPTTEESSRETSVNPVQQLKGKEKKLDFWELQKELGTSQENVMLLEVQLNREKNRYTRLKAALKAVADKAKKKTKCIPEE